MLLEINPASTDKLTCLEYGDTITPAYSEFSARYRYTLEVLFCMDCLIIIGNEHKNVWSGCFENVPLASASYLQARLYHSRTYIPTPPPIFVSTS